MRHPARATPTASRYDAHSIDPTRATVGTFAVVLIDIFLGPFVWILVGIAIDLLLWIVLALGGVIAWLALGRPWQLVVLDGDGATLAIGKVKGRRAAHELASSAQARLAAGLDPATAISTP